MTTLRLALALVLSVPLAVVQVSPPSLAFWIAVLALGGVVLGVVAASYWAAPLAVASMVAARFIALGQDEARVDFPFSFFLVLLLLLSLPPIAGALVGAKIGKCAARHRAAGVSS